MHTRLMLGIVAGITSAAAAQRLEIGSFQADNGAQFDMFGTSVVFQGDLAAIGSMGDDMLKGSAYLFDITDRGAPVQLAKVAASDGDPIDSFGRSIAFGDGVLLVGAYSDESAGPYAGSAYLFDISDPHHPVEIAALRASDGADHEYFGRNVAIKGTTAMITADGDDAGSVYIFEISDPANPLEIAEFSAVDGQPGDGFGISISLDGSRAIIGADGDDDNGNVSGSAYLFDLTDPANPVQIAKLLAPDGDNLDRFGGSVAIRGQVAVVGATGNGIGGAAYVFEATTGQFVTKLTAYDSGPGQHFGTSVATDGALAVVGDSHDDERGDEAGAAYAYSVPDGRLISKLASSDGIALDRLGATVALHDGLAFVAAVGDFRDSIQAGRVYVFETTPCPTDLSGDGIVNTIDVITFLGAWAADDESADWNGDGQVNTMDVSGFLNDWVAGC